MAKFSRIEVAMKMHGTGLVPLFYHPDVNLGKEVLQACYRGGGRLLEFTNRGDGAYEVFRELITFARKELPELAMGVGSVTDAPSASMYLLLGADFVVTPVLRKDIAIVCNRRKVLWSPGCGSLSEIAMAEELGCEIVKLFPGGIYGPGFIKAIKGPQPWTSIMPTGGVSPTEESLGAWFNAGAACVGMGSKLITKEILQNRDFKRLEDRVKETLQIINRINK